MYVFLVYLPLVLAALVWNLPLDPLPWTLSLAAGLLLWTPIEYVVHRYALHRMAPHYEHHNEPAVVAYIFAPLWLSGISAALLWGLLALIAGPRRGALVEAGTVIGYLLYEALHVRMHSNAAGGPILRALRKHHFYHHFADDTRCFGVTSPVWDRILGTAARTPDFPYDGREHDPADLHVHAAGEGQKRG